MNGWKWCPDAVAFESGGRDIGTPGPLLFLPNFTLFLFLNFTHFDVHLARSAIGSHEVYW